MGILCLKGQNRVLSVNSSVDVHAMQFTLQVMILHLNYRLVGGENKRLERNIRDEPDFVFPCTSLNSWVLEVFLPVVVFSFGAAWNAA